MGKEFDVCMQKECILTCLQKITDLIPLVDHKFEILLSLNSPMAVKFENF